MALGGHLWGQLQCLRLMAWQQPLFTEKAGDILCPQRQRNAGGHRGGVFKDVMPLPPRAWRETNVEGDLEALYSFLNVSFLGSPKVFLGV